MNDITIVDSFESVLDGSAGIVDTTIDLLKESHFNEHLSSISSMSVDDSWNKDLVDNRTDIMLDIIWNRVSKWIF